jgi:hypothetical protein
MDTVFIAAAEENGHPKQEDTYTYLTMTDAPGRGKDSDKRKRGDLGTLADQQIPVCTGGTSPRMEEKQQYSAGGRSMDVENFKSV